MSEYNRDLPGSVPGNFPTTPGEDRADYTRDVPGGTTGTTGLTGSSGLTGTTGTYAAGTNQANITPFIKPDGATTSSTSNFTEREYGAPVTRPHEDETLWNREGTGAAGGAIGGASAGGVAAYELNRDRQTTQPTSTTTTTTTTTTSQPRTTTTSSQPVSGLNRDDKGYGAYQRSGEGGNATGGELSNRFGTYDLNDPNRERTEAMKEQQRRIEEQKERRTSQTEETSTTSRTAATAGAGTAATAGGATALSSGTERRTSATAGDYDAYQRAGEGRIATEGELENKFATYDLNDPNAERTEAMKAEIARIEEMKRTQQMGTPGEQKSGGLLSKLGLGGSKSKESETTTSSTTTREPVGTSSYTESPSYAETGGTTSSYGTTGQEVRRSSMTQGSVDPHEEHLVLHKSGSHPDAPTLIVREKPGV